MQKGMKVYSFSAYWRQSESHEHQKEKNEILFERVPDIRGVRALSRKMKGKLRHSKQKSGSGRSPLLCIRFFFRFIYFSKYYFNIRDDDKHFTRYEMSWASNGRWVRGLAGLAWLGLLVFTVSRHPKPCDLILLLLAAPRH